MERRIIMDVRVYESPIGLILLKAQCGYITNISTLEDSEANFYYNGIKKSKEDKENTYIFNSCINQLNEYFLGKRKAFDFKFKNQGTEFRGKVWKELEKVPYGNTISYKDLAIAINNPKAVRAVGGANHNNNIYIVVPCHRVIGADGSLTGYGGGLWRKKWLIDHEKRHM